MESKVRKKYVGLIVLFYFLWTNCFNFYLLADKKNQLGEIRELVMLGITILLFPMILHSWKSKFLDSSISRLLLLAVFSAFTALVFWGQTPYYSVRAISSMMLPLAVFYILKKYNVSIREMMFAVVIVCIMHGIFQIIGMLTFPDVLFGNAGKEAIERSMGDMEKRGVLRLAVPGADFVPLTMFIVMVVAKKQKKLYLFLIPLTIVLLMRGTRTPFFITVLVCFCYYVQSLRRKWIAVAFLILSYLSFSALYESLLNSTADNVLVNYVQMSEQQLNNDEEDIRVQMSNFYLFDFNDGNILKVIFGNGIPSKSEYGNIITYMAENYSYYVVDVGFVEIFVYFGILGLVVYFSLLRNVINANVIDSCVFAKLGFYYFFIILPTNSMLLSNPLPVALIAYVIYRGQILAKASYRRKQTTSFLSIKSKIHKSKEICFYEK